MHCPGTRGPLQVAAVLASPLPSGPGTRSVMFSALDDHSWIEVLRHQEFLEEPGLGHHNATWWFVARGSGTWLSVGRMGS